MELTNKQKAFLDFIPISQVRKTILQMYVLIIFLVPLIISNYFVVNQSYNHVVKIAVIVDILLFIISIPILIKPKSFLGIFHLLIGVTAIFVSVLLFSGFVIEAKLTYQDNLINLIFSILIYVAVLFAANILIIRANFMKYPKSNYKMTSVLVLAPIIGLTVYNVINNTFNINGVAIAAFLLAIGVGIPIHSVYRGYIILKYKYRPLE